MPTVIIYSTPTCPFCKMAKNYFGRHNVEYKEFDVASDMQAREQMIEKSGQIGVPVIDIDGQVVVGFDEPRLAEVLKVKS